MRSAAIDADVNPPNAPSRRAVLAGALAAFVPALPIWSARVGLAQTPLAAREVPARLLPVPDTISEGLKPVVGAPLAPGWNDVPTDAAGWRTLAASSGDEAAPVLKEIRDKLGVTVESTTIAGVPSYICTPDRMPDANRNRVLMHLHGGGYVLYPGLVGAGEAMMMAGYGGFRVVSVDYRMSPDHPFPAALDDTMAVWRALIAETDPGRMAIFGTSAGGGLTLAAVMRCRAEGVTMPAAIGPGSPWSDLSGDGDSVTANEYVDNVLVANAGWVGAAGRLYAGANDIRDPLISPVYGDFTGFPPAILTTGTRDLLLSDTVRVHRKLRQAGVEAFLQVFEAQSHAQFLTPFVDETAEAFGEIGRFFDRHLAS